MKRILTYIAIIMITAALIGALFWKHELDLENIRDAYRAEQNAAIDGVVRNVETTFNAFYQGVRTMTLLPGVRSIDRYGKTFNADSKAAMQQIYNNTFLNVTLSEVYILPRSLEPHRIDPNTGKPEEPVLTFDEFIVSKDGGAGKEKKEGLEEVEIFEYELMKKQLEYLASTFPTNAAIKGLDVPAVTGEEVVTCDNSEFTRADFDAKNDAPRKGIALTVPVFDMSGNFAGAVSGVVRTNILKKLVPKAYYGIINKTHGWRIIDEPAKSWQDSLASFESGKANPGLLVSQIRSLKIKDSSPWELWVAKDDQDFYARSDVKQAGTILTAGIATSLVLGLIMLYSAWSAFTNQSRLENKVNEKTAALSQRNSEMALILNNAEEGFLTANLDGTMAEERSAIVAKWFGPAKSDARLWDYIASGARGPATMLRIGWEQLIEDIFPFDVCVDQMPRLVERNGMSLALRYKGVNGADGKLFKVLVMIADVTALVEAARRELQQRELVSVFQRFSSDRRGFHQFIADARSIVARIQDRDGTDARSRELDFREVHTLKGNSSQFGLLSVADTCHRIESDLSESGRAMTAEERSLLKSSWDKASIALKDFVEDAGEKQVSVAIGEYETLLKQMRSVGVASSLIERFAAWTREPTVVPFKRLGEQVRALSARLEKGDVDIEIKDNGVRLDTDTFRDVWMNVTHLVRNTVDHGFETGEERQKGGKGRARLEMESIESDKEIILSFADNGKGIDWEKLRAVAASRGVPHKTQSDLEQALFVDGVSTKENISDVSGRGVGMAALKSAVAGVGGVIEVRSVRGNGTTFVLRFSKSKGQVLQ